ncbi:MAG: hypothetical protein V5A68_05165 [Candidatus Thermoplasmatota archaeon]
MLNRLLLIENIGLLSKEPIHEITGKAGIKDEEYITFDDPRNLVKQWLSILKHQI